MGATSLRRGDCRGLGLTARRGARRRHGGAERAAHEDEFGARSGGVSAIAWPRIHSGAMRSSKKRRNGARRIPE
jgi:hypothetical protein